MANAGASKDLTALEDALPAAHLPSLIAAMVHLSGDASLLRPEWRPKYIPLLRTDSGIPETERPQIYGLARQIIGDHLAGRLPKAAPLDAGVVRQLMHFVSGAEIPEHYTEFLMDELSLQGESSRDVGFESPKLQAAARRMKVLVIGAGMSGLLAGLRLSQAGIPFEIVEKNADVGGTWLENTYPGCRVDSSNHIYSYSFEPNHLWPQYFSTQPVLLDYFRGVADRHGLREHIRFETSAEAVVWDERRSVWRVRLSGPDGRTETVEATAVISAVGQLNRPRLPDIPGRDSFAGPAFHSAEWRHDVELSGKRVAVIGTGASAFQFAPEIAPKVASLKIFQRTPPWLSPSPQYHDDVPDGMKWLLEHVPYYDKWYRFWLFWMATDGFLPMAKVDPDWKGGPEAVSEANAVFREGLLKMLLAQVEDRPDLVDKIVPAYPMGGKRSLMDNGTWIRALKRPNVEVVTEGIREIDAQGLVTRDGARHDVDVMIYGTGFQASRFLQPMSVKGRGGHDLHEGWGEDARAYLGITTPGFPNFFMLYGPNTNIVANGSIIFFSECAVRYVLGCLRLMADRDAATIEVRPEVCAAFNDRVDQGNRMMAWGAPQVSSWYKSATGRVSQNWPFALVDYWKATVAPDPADFRLQRTAETVT